MQDDLSERRMKSLVTVITPYLNAKRFLPGFVNSLRSQTADYWFCIMVDDGSSDGGPELLNDLVAVDSRFLLISNTNPKRGPGPASARNCALALVQTDYVAFCDVDDLWHPEKLERQLTFHTFNQLDLSVSAYGRFHDNEMHAPLKSIVCPPLTLRSGTLRGRNPIPMLTVIVSAEIVKEGFQEVAHEDFLFWLQLFKNHASIRYGCLPIVLAFYCIHSENVSRQKLIMPLWTYRVFRSFGKTRLSSLANVATWLVDHLLGRTQENCFGQYKHTQLKDLLLQAPIQIRLPKMFL